MRGLTSRQQVVLRLIESSVRTRGYPPTLREFGASMGIRSTNGVNDHLRALERKGYLKREDKKSRAVRTTNGGADVETVDVPVLGRIAAGAPALAVENAEGTLRVDRSLVGGAGAQVFALRVRGDSMVDAGIRDGDFVFVRQQPTAERGDIVAALVGNEATVKYYFPERDYVRLQPANGRMAPILVRREESRPPQVLGVVVGLYRKI